MSTVPFLDVGAATRELQGEIAQALTRATNSGWYILGPEVKAFEAQWATWCESAHAVGVANGLDAIVLALKAVGVGPGDEVIVPSNTYIATWLAVSMVGATPVPVEPDERTHNLDPSKIEAALTPKTKALLPVHLYGQPAVLGPMLELAKKRGLKVIDDAAQAHGARWQGKRIGGLTDATAWSFYPGKNLGALGDAGAVTTNDAAIAERLRVLRNYGSRVKYVNDEQGVNSRLDELHAAVLSVKVPHLDAWNARRTKIAQRYQAELQGLPLVLPEVAPGAESAWHLYVVRSSARDRLQALLKERGVETLIHYPIPPHEQQAYAAFKGRALPLASKLAKEVLSLPMGPHLADAQVTQVIAAVREAAVSAARGG